MFLCNYNIAINSYSIILLERSHSIEFSNHPTFAAHASIVVGLIMGIIVFGFSNYAAYRLTISLRICSCLLVLGGILSITTGYLPWSVNSRKLLEFAIARFIVGIGCGGLCSSVSLIFKDSCAKPIDNCKLAFIYGPIGSLGLLAAPLIVGIFDQWKISADGITWKVALSVGTIPGILLLPYHVDNTFNDHINQKNDYNGDHSFIVRSQRMLETIFEQIPNIFSNTTLKSYLVGTYTSFMCFDAIFYGNFLVIVRVVDHLFLKTAYNPSSFWRISVVGANCGLFFWLGGWFSVIGLRHISAMAIQLHGFILMSGAFILLAVIKLFSNEECCLFLMLTYSFMFLFAGFGPAPMTYLMPGILFPGSLKTPLDGLMAIWGKIGAVVGILLSHYFYVEIATLMIVFSAFSLLGAGSTLIILNAKFTDRKGQYDGYSLVGSHGFEQENLCVTLAHTDSHAENNMTLSSV